RQSSTNGATLISCIWSDDCCCSGSINVLLPTKTGLQPRFAWRCPAPRRFGRREHSCPCAAEAVWSLKSESSGSGSSQNDRKVFCDLCPSGLSPKCPAPSGERGHFPGDRTAR